MKKNPALLAQPNCGHYDACCTRMIQIKSFSSRLFLFTTISNGFMILSTFLGLHLGPFSLLPSLAGENYSIGYMLIQLAELILMEVLAVLGFIRYKECSSVLCVIYVLAVLSGIGGGRDCIMNGGFIVAVIGVILSYPSFSVCADFKQLVETEGYPYFNRLFEEPENPGYQATYMEQFKKVKKNPERRFGDNAPIPLTGDELMTDLKDVPRADPLIKSENHQKDDEEKYYFKEV